MPERSSGRSDCCLFMSRVLGVRSISWRTLKRMKTNEALPLKYMHRGKKPLPYLVHDEVYAWVEGRGTI